MLGETKEDIDEEEENLRLNDDTCSGNIEAATEFSAKCAAKNIVDEIFEDIIGGLYDAAIFSPTIGVFIGLILYTYLTYYPSNHHHKHISSTSSSIIRPLLKPHEISKLKWDIFHSETDLHYNGDIISFKHHQHTDEEGNFPLPDLFYNGVLFGLSKVSSHIFEYATVRSESAISSVPPSVPSDFNALNRLGLLYEPSNICPWTSRNNQTGYFESGVTLHYSFDDLSRLGIISSGTSEPWKRILKHVKEVAVELNVPYIIMWHPRRFGEDKAVEVDNRYKHVLQSLLPVRTGYGSLRHDHTVWLSRLNGEVPRRPVFVYRKPWTTNDHWTHYNDDSSRSSSRNRSSSAEQEVEVV